MFCRLYTGDDGQSHFQELYMESGFAAFYKMQPATGVMFRQVEPGEFQDWHQAPQRQYVITLAGKVEIGIADGTVKTFGAGDVMLAEDLTGQGHTTRPIGDSPRVFLTIPLA